MLKIGDALSLPEYFLADEDRYFYDGGENDRD